MKHVGIQDLEQTPRGGLLHLLHGPFLPELPGHLQPLREWPFPTHRGLSPAPWDKSVQTQVAFLIYRNLRFPLHPSPANLKESATLCI